MTVLGKSKIPVHLLDLFTSVPHLFVPYSAPQGKQLDMWWRVKEFFFGSHLQSKLFHLLVGSLWLISFTVSHVKEAQESKTPTRVISEKSQIEHLCILYYYFSATLLRWKHLRRRKRSQWCSHVQCTLSWQSRWHWKNIAVFWRLGFPSYRSSLGKRQVIRLLKQLKSHVTIVLLPSQSNGT